MTTKKNLPTNQPRWIAERRLERLDAVGGLVIVRMGRPERPLDAKEWRCPYIITGLGDDGIHFARGIETMDTLMNTFRGIRARIERSGIPVRWEWMEGDHIGFPEYVDRGFGFSFEQQMERMILCEVEKLCNEPHDCLAVAGLRVAMLEAKHGTHGLVELAKRRLAEVQEMNESALAEHTSRSKRSRWIASRTLVCFEHDKRRVIVRIGRPQMVPTSTVWRCPYEVRGLPEHISDFGFGVDSIHATQTALDGIRSVLLESDIPLQWEGVRPADPGFPMAIPMGFGREFEQRMDKMIADKIEERIRPIRERQERRDAQRKARRKPQAK